MAEGVLVVAARRRAGVGSATHRCWITFMGFSKYGQLLLLINACKKEFAIFALAPSQVSSPSHVRSQEEWV